MIETWEKQYLRVLQDLLNLAAEGRWKGNRTQYRTVGGFGLQLDVPLVHGRLPALVSKTVHLKSVVAELMWFLRGDTNIAFLKEYGVSIWDEWADERGELGPVYGKQWRSWWTVNRQVDQIAKLLEDLRQRPESRRMIVSAWNPEDLPFDGYSPQQNVSMGQQALAPCHMLFQAYVEPLDLFQRMKLAVPYGVPEALAAELPRYPGEQVAAMLDRYAVPTRGLCLRVDQRSADWFLGVPFNIASYALLTHLLCAVVDDLAPLKLVMQFGDYHLYENQVEAAREQVDRFVKIQTAPAEVPHELQYPRLRIPRPKRLKDFSGALPEDVELFDYRPWGRIVPPAPAV